MEKELDNNMELCEALIKDFDVNMRAVFNKQAADNTYLNRNDFATCYNRAAAAYMDACKNGKKKLALAIAKENEKNHQIDTVDEQTLLEGTMTDEEITISTQSGWIN